VKRVLHRMLDATRAVIGAASPRHRTTRAMLVRGGVRLPPINMTAHIPRDHARQVGSQYYIKEAMRVTPPARVVMDLGCGDGSSAALFRSEQPGVRWVGVDITESGTVRDVHAESVVIFDGLRLPFADNSIELVYTNQVFEHVRHPQALLLEIQRVLMPGGVFIGSVSQLEALPRVQPLGWLHPLRLGDVVQGRGADSGGGAPKHRRHRSDHASVRRRSARARTVVAAFAAQRRDRRVGSSNRCVGTRGQRQEAPVLRPVRIPGPQTANLKAIRLPQNSDGRCSSGYCY